MPHGSSISARMIARDAVPPLVVLSWLALLPTRTAWAGPPYFTDDPVPTDEGHYEIYAFADSLRNSGGTSSDAGIDFNYGGARELQLTAVLPVTREQPRGAPEATGFGNVELAAKYRFVHPGGGGWQVAVFPRVFLKSASARVGDHHASFQLPLWAGRDWDSWSTFGGGGCVLSHGDGSRNHCFAGWVLARQFGERMQLGAELYHQSADAAGARPWTLGGIGLRYDASEHLHLLAYGSGGLQNAATEHQYSWYASILFTF